jgi:hypothetical protein
MQPEQEGTGSTLGPEYQEWYQAHGQAWQEYYGRVSTETAGLMAVQLSEMCCAWLITGCANLVEDRSGAVFRECLQNPYTEVAAARQRQLPPPQTQSFQERLQPQMREPQQPAMQRQRQPYASDAAPPRDPRSRRQVAAQAQPPAAQVVPVICDAGGCHSNVQQAAPFCSHQWEETPV